MKKEAGTRCLVCEKELKGRADKKFCNDYCRNTFNNQKKEPSRLFMKDVNSILRKNRDILCNLIHPQQKQCRVRREQLLVLGFSFQYFTHQLTNRNGYTYCCCYDMAYFQTTKGDYLITAGL